MKKTKQLLSIEKAICKAAGVSVEDIDTRNREQNIADARAAIWLIAREYLHYSYPVLGKMYKRNHTTVMAGVKKIKSMPVSMKILSYIRTVCPELPVEKMSAGEHRDIKNWDLE